MIKEELKAQACGLFATRDNLAEAMEYAISIFETLEPMDKVHCMTALMVVINTIHESMEKENDM